MAARNQQHRSVVWCWLIHRQTMISFCHSRGFDRRTERISPERPCVVYNVLDWAGLHAWHVAFDLTSRLCRRLARHASLHEATRPRSDMKTCAVSVVGKDNSPISSRHPVRQQPLNHPPPRPRRKAAHKPRATRWLATRRQRTSSVRCDLGDGEMMM